MRHEDDESAFEVRNAPGGYEVSLERPGLKARYRLATAREPLAQFAQRLLEALEQKRRVAEIDGPTDGKLRLAATLAPGEEGELLLVALAREGSAGEETEMEYVRFASRGQMADFAEALLGLR
jgi:hypothetical protein